MLLFDRKRKTKETRRHRAILALLICTAVLNDLERRQSPNFSTFNEPNNRFQGTNFAKLCSLAGRCDNDNPIPISFLAHIGCLKIPAQVRGKAE